MTDSDIKKAMEHCKNGKLDDCHGCPRFSDEYTLTTCTCMENLMTIALDLINRLEDENERLDKEVGRLSQVVLYNDGVTEMEVEEAKAEAYKEFAERLKERMYTVGFDIDELLNEMVGEKGCENCELLACDGCELYEMVGE